MSFFNQVYRGRSSGLAFAGTVFLAVIGYVLGQVPLALVAGIYAAKYGSGEAGLAEVQQSLDFSKIGMSQNLTLVLILLTFVGALLGLWAGVRFLHRRPFRTLINGGASIRWGRIYFGFFAWLAMAAIGEWLSYLAHPEQYTYRFDPGGFLPLLVIVLLLMPIQTSVEEFFTRGYLMQYFGYLGGYPWLAAVGSSVLFAAMHGMNPEVDKFGWMTMMTYYFTVGLFLAILTILDDGLELALGIHAATNMFGATFVTYSGAAIQTPALFLLSAPDVNGMVLHFIIAAVVFLYIADKKFGPWRADTLFLEIAAPLANEEVWEEEGIREV